MTKLKNLMKVKDIAELKRFIAILDRWKAEEAQGTIQYTWLIRFQKQCINLIDGVNDVVSNQVMYDRIIEAKMLIEPVKEMYRLHDSIKYKKVYDIWELLYYAGADLMLR